MSNPDVPDLLTSWWSADQSQPLITYYGPDSVRIELSGATVANYVAKTANYFRDELLVDPGDVLNVVLPLHWQSPILVLSAWAAGLTVCLDDNSGAVATAAAAIVDTQVEERLAISLHPWGMPLGAATPPGWADLAAEVRLQPDLAPAPTWPTTGQPWVQASNQDLSMAQLLDFLPSTPSNPVVVAVAPQTPQALATMAIAAALGSGRLLIADRVDPAGLQ